MRIHTSLSEGDFYAVLRADERLGQDLYFESLTEHGSRTHDRAFEVKIWSHNRTSISGAKRRHPNSGFSGGASEYGATFDEWGYFLAVLFELDPNARVASVYEHRGEFHDRTGYAYLAAVKRY